MSLMPIPSTFIKDNVSLSWRETLWGYEHGLIGWPQIVDVAMDRLLHDSNDDLEIELAGLGKSEAERVSELLRVLAGRAPEEAEDIVRSKWLYLALAWLYENREAVGNPLGEVERIYADFDYPEEIEAFVTYMPATDGYDPVRHTVKENEDRMMLSWEKYLSKARGKL